MLVRANLDILFNLIVYRAPTKMHISDLCPYRLGGFLVLRRRVQRLKLLPDLAGKVLNNLLEFITEIICIQVDILEREINLCDCCLLLGDNSSTVSQLYRSNFNSEDQQVDKETACYYDSLCINEEVYLYSQYFKGVQNVVADILSHNIHIPGNVLISLLFLVYLKQMLMNFRISPLLPEIESWVFRTLQLSLKSYQISRNR